MKKGIFSLFFITLLTNSCIFGIKLKRDTIITIDRENKRVISTREETEEEAIVKVITQLDKVNSKLEELCYFIINKNVKTKNKCKTIFQLKLLRKSINAIKIEPFSEATPAASHFLLILNHHLMSHIYKAMQNGLEDIPEVNLEEVKFKLKISNIGQLDTMYLENEKLYKKLNLANL